MILYICRWSIQFIVGFFKDNTKKEQIHMENNVLFDQEVTEALDFLISMSPEQSKVVDSIIILDSNNESDNDWYYDR